MKKSLIIIFVLTLIACRERPRGSELFDDPIRNDLFSLPVKFKLFGHYLNDEKVEQNRGYKKILLQDLVKAQNNEKETKPLFVEIPASYLNKEIYNANNRVRLSNVRNLNKNSKIIVALQIRNFANGVTVTPKSTDLEVKLFNDNSLNGIVTDEKIKQELLYNLFVTGDIKSAIAVLKREKNELKVVHNGRYAVSGESAIFHTTRDGQVQVIVHDGFRFDIDMNAKVIEKYDIPSLLGDKNSK